MKKGTLRQKGAFESVQINSFYLAFSGASIL